jgi:hypothetical protein
MTSLPAQTGSALVHDSYHCGQFKVGQTVAFPTRREMSSYNFVGAQVQQGCQIFLGPNLPNWEKYTK